MDQLQYSFSEMQKLIEIDRSKIEEWRAIGASVGRPGIVEEIKNAYKQTGLPLIDLIRSSAKAGEKEDLRKHFHKMKSGCGNMGFVRLQKMCEYSEEFLKNSENQSADEIKYICFIIDTEFERSLVLLESL